jgi:hypothetical protein
MYKPNLQPLSETFAVVYNHTRVRDGKGLALRRRAGAKRSPEQPGPQATPKSYHD